MNVEISPCLRIRYRGKQNGQASFVYSHYVHKRSMPDEHLEGTMKMNARAGSARAERKGKSRVRASFRSENIGELSSREKREKRTLRSRLQPANF